MSRVCGLCDRIFAGNCVSHCRMQVQHDTQKRRTLSFPTFWPALAFRNPLRLRVRLQGFGSWICTVQGLGFIEFRPQAGVLNALCDCP